MIGKVGQNSRIVVIKDAVRVKVPVKSPDIEFRGGIKIQSGDVVPEHWHNAFAVGRIVINRNFYGIAQVDLGRKITATVQVF